MKNGGKRPEMEKNHFSAPGKKNLKKKISPTNFFFSIKIGKTGQKWSKIPKNGQKSPKNDKIGKK